MVALVTQPAFWNCKSSLFPGLLTVQNEVPNPLSSTFSASTAPASCSSLLPALLQPLLQPLGTPLSSLPTTKSLCSSSPFCLQHPPLPVGDFTEAKPPPLFLTYPPARETCTRAPGNSLDPGTQEAMLSFGNSICRPLVFEFFQAVCLRVPRTHLAWSPAHSEYPQMPVPACRPPVTDSGAGGIAHMRDAGW